MIKRLALVAAIAAQPGHAGQPIYVSMSECAGIFVALTAQIKTPGPRLDRIMGAQENWVAAAHAEAGHDVTDLINVKAQEWRDKGPAVVFTQEFDDWAAYCRSLAKHKGLKILTGK